MNQIAEIGGYVLEIGGIVIILVFGIYSLIVALYRFFKKDRKDDVYKTFRSQFGRGILLGLEFMVGADIIQTVAVDLTYQNVFLLAIIVAIRTFLNFTLELEISGR